MKSALPELEQPPAGRKVYGIAKSQLITISEEKNGQVATPLGHLINPNALCSEQRACPQNIVCMKDAWRLSENSIFANAG